MESSRYLCAIKVLYTGRATFEIKGADRTSVSREAKTVNSFCPCPFSHSFSLSLSVPLFTPVTYVCISFSLPSFSLLASSLSVYDRFTYNGAGDKKTKREGSVRRSGKDQTRDFVRKGRIALEPLYVVTLDVRVVHSGFKVNTPDASIYDATFLFTVGRSSSTSGTL